MRLNYMIENKEIKDMTCKEAKKILIHAFNNKSLFHIYDENDYLQAFCMSLIALEELKDKRISKENLKLIE